MPSSWLQPFMPMDWQSACGRGCGKMATRRGRCCLLHRLAPCLPTPHMSMHMNTSRPAAWIPGANKGLHSNICVPRLHLRRSHRATNTPQPLQLPADTSGIECRSTRLGGSRAVAWLMLVSKHCCSCLSWTQGGLRALFSAAIHLAITSSRRW